MMIIINAVKPTDLNVKSCWSLTAWDWEPGGPRQEGTKGTSLHFYIQRNKEHRVGEMQRETLGSMV